MTDYEKSLTWLKEGDMELMDCWVDETQCGNAILMEQYLYNWYNAKNKQLFKLFGEGNLILKKPVKIKAFYNDIIDSFNRNEEFMTVRSDFLTILGRAMEEALLSQVPENIREACEAGLITMVQRNSWSYRFLRNNPYFSNYCWDWAVDWDKETNQDDYENLRHDLYAIFNGFVILEDYFHNNFSRCYRVFGGDEISYNFTMGDKTLRIFQEAKLSRTLRAVIKFLREFVPSNSKTMNNIMSMGEICFYGGTTPWWDACLDAFKHLMNVQSTIMNTADLEGNLCLSIHPMDYMTASDNSYGWTSCMNWKDNGEYHAGTLEMMTSDSVIVAYFEGKREWIPCGGVGKAWSNKRWRVFMIYDNDFIASIKQYPYNSDELNKLAMDWLADLAKENMGEEIDTSTMIEYHGDNAPYCIDFYTDYMYNDTSRDYTLLYFNKTPHFKGSYRDFYYGQGCFCLECGKLRCDREDYEGAAESVFCIDCRDVTFCADCGGIINSDYDDVIHYHGDSYHRDCFFENHTFKNFGWDDDIDDYIDINDANVFSCDIYYEAGFAHGISCTTVYITKDFIEKYKDCFCLRDSKDRYYYKDFYLLNPAISSELHDIISEFLSEEVCPWYEDVKVCYGNGEGRVDFIDKAS